MEGYLRYQAVCQGRNTKVFFRGPSFSSPMGLRVQARDTEGLTSTLNSPPIALGPLQSFLLPGGKPVLGLVPHPHPVCALMNLACAQCSLTLLPGCTSRQPRGHAGRAFLAACLDLERRESVPWDGRVCSPRKRSNWLSALEDTRLGQVKQAATGSLGPFALGPRGPVAWPGLAWP